MIRKFRVWPAGLDSLFVTIRVGENECPACAFAAASGDVLTARAPEVFGFQETPDGEIVYRVLTLQPGGWSCREADEEEVRAARSLFESQRLERDPQINCRPGALLS